ncbi:hypothetical protein D3C73_1579810 [compost metagenome]
MSDEIMKEHSDVLKIGNIAFFEAFVGVLTRQIKKDEKKDVSVFAFSVKDITKVGETNQ